MERIILAVNSRKIDENAVRFACHLSKLTNSLLTGIFLENLVLEETVHVVETGAFSFIESISLHERQETEEEQIMKKENMLRFAEITEELGARATIYKEIGSPADNVLTESRFADVIIVDAATSFARFEEGSPSRFVKEILQQAECPVIIAPKGFTRIESITFCYGGNKSSAFAIRQFTYLFPELNDKKVRLFYMTPPDEISLQEQMALSNWLKFHYNDIEIVTIQEETVTSFFRYLGQEENGLIIMGAYGRGLLDSFFIDETEVEEENTNPALFISHY